MKLIGSIIILASCGWFGFSLASSHVRQERILRELVGAIGYMQCDLQYRLTPLPDLCRQLEGFCRDKLLISIFHRFYKELEAQTSPEPSACFSTVLKTFHNLPPIIRQCLEALGDHLGHFDLPGQLEGLEQVRNFCREQLDAHCNGKVAQRRSYQTLGLCVGAALVVLFI